MKKLLRFTGIFCMMAILFLASSQTVEAKPSVSADSAVLMDLDTGTILYKKNMDKKQYPASITKILTSLVALENSSLEEMVTFSESAVLNLEYGASNIGVQPGEKLSMEECQYAIMLMSANEVCNGVAEHISGSIDNYVKLMNQYAKSIGCTGTHFANTNGLWQEDHYTTAHDMALIAKAAYENPTFRKVTGTRDYNIEKTNKHKDGIYLYNHHKMLRPAEYPQYGYEYCVGGKTGYTEKCKWTLVTYAKKGDVNLVSVVMKTAGPVWLEPNQYTDTIKLLNYGFEKFAKHSITQETEEINNQLFTKFSPYMNSANGYISMDEGASVILPKKVKLEDTEKKIESYPTPQTDSEGNTIIGKITYLHEGKEWGGSYLYYKGNTDTSNIPSLTDSVDVTEWFKEAVEVANEEPFPWKTLIWVIVLILAVGAAVVLVVWYTRTHWEERRRKTRYKRSHRNMKRQKRYKRRDFYSNRRF